MKMTMAQLREILMNEAPYRWKDTASPQAVINAIEEWTMSDGNRGVITPRVVAGMKLMLDDGELEPPPSNSHLHRGIRISGPRLARWLQIPNLGDSGSERTNGKLVVGNEGPSSWSSQYIVAIDFAVLQDHHSHEGIVDPYYAVFSSKVSDNPGAFVDLNEGPNAEHFSSFNSEMESISITPVKVMGVSWVRQFTDDKKTLRRTSVTKTLKELVGKFL